MLQQENKTGKWIALAVSLPLSAFTIWRAWDLMTTILPADQALAAVFGIAALDGGMVAWIFAYMKSKSSDQRRASGIGAFIDFAGTGLVTFIDLMLSGVKRGLVGAPANLFLAAIILISVVVVINVGIGWLYVLGDPKKKQEIRDQISHDKINDMASALIETNAEMYAPQFAQVKVAQWLQQAQMMHGIGGALQLPTAPVVESLPAPQNAASGNMFTKAKDAVLNKISPAPAAPTTEPLDYDKLAKSIIAQSTPLTSPQLPTTAPQLGTTNNSNGSH